MIDSDAERQTPGVDARGIVLRGVNPSAQHVAKMPLQRVGTGQAVIAGQRQCVFDDGVLLSASESSIVKLTVTNNAVAIVEDALSLTSNHGLTRANPLERHFRDVLCGRVHTPQDDATRVNAGRLALGV